MKRLPSGFFGKAGRVEQCGCLLRVEAGPVGVGREEFLVRRIDRARARPGVAGRPPVLAIRLAVDGSGTSPAGPRAWRRPDCACCIPARSTTRPLRSPWAWRRTCFNTYAIESIILDKSQLRQINGGILCIGLYLAIINGIQSRNSFIILEELIYFILFRCVDYIIFKDCLNYCCKASSIYRIMLNFSYKSYCTSLCMKNFVDLT